MPTKVYDHYTVKTADGKLFDLGRVFTAEEISVENADSAEPPRPGDVSLTIKLESKRGIKNLVRHLERLRERRNRAIRREKRHREKARRERLKALGGENHAGPGI